MKFAKIFVSAFLILTLHFHISAQGDPVSSADSLLLVRSEAKGINLANIDLEIARYYHSNDLDSLKIFIPILENHLSKRYDIRIDAFIKKFKSYLAHLNLEAKVSMDLAQEALILFEKIEDYREMGWLNIQLGTGYFRLGDLEKATKTQLLALGYFEQVNHQRGIAQAYNELGRISYQSGQSSIAKEYFEFALSIYNELELDIPKNKIYNNLGILLLENGDLQGALSNFKKAAKGYASVGQLRQLAFVYGNIALSYEDLGIRDSALIYARLALRSSNEINDSYGVLTATINLGYFLRLENKFDSCKICLDKALGLAVEKEFPVYIENIYEEYADFFAATGDYKTAYSYHQKKDSIHEQFIDDESKNQIDELIFSQKQKIKEAELMQLRQNRKMQSKINLLFILLFATFIAVVILLSRANKRINSQKDQLEQNNILLNSTNNNLEKSERILKEMIQNKNKLFSIVAHDLRNPISAVSGFSELLSQNYDAIDDDSRKEYIEQILQAAMRTLSLLENLLLWARSQMDEIVIKKTKVPVVRLIQEGTISLISILDSKNIDLVIEVEEEFDLMVDVEMIKAVIRNLVSNAIKYSYTGKKIIIECKRTADNLCIAVIDEGTGMKEEVLSKLFQSDDPSSVKGTSDESGTGLGLIISNDYTVKNGGTIKVESEYGKGSVFTICFPAE